MTRRGIGVSPGIAIGRALVVTGRRPQAARRQVAPEEIGTERARLGEAIAACRKQLAELHDKARHDLGEEAAGILEAHLLMLDDPHLAGEAGERIANRGVNAEWAVSEVVEELTSRIRGLGDEALRERARDVEDVGDRILDALGGFAPELPGAGGEHVLVTHDLAPSDAARLDRRHVQAMVVDVGGRTSHTGIIAKSLEIPAVVGLGNLAEEVHTGDSIIVDGNEGEVVLRPSRTVVQEYRNKKLAQEAHERELLANRDLPSVTADGHKVFLQANIDFPGEVESAVRFGAEGIGLFRSEFLFLNAATSGPPDEDHQYEVYRALAERVYPRSAIVRTIDFGGGKVTPVEEGNRRESNPIMGLRAIRYCLRHRDLFKTQLRALLRASVHGRLKIMFPMITSVSELRLAKGLIEQAKEELRHEGKRLNEALSVGIMIEVPAAAVVADLLAREVDFFSIGTNDLIQFFLAIDRDNPEVSYLYEPLHPGVLRLLQQVIEAGHRSGIRVGMCGEMASDPSLVPLLIGLGLDELSMNAVSIPLVKRIIRTIEHRETEAIVAHALTLPTAAEVEEYVLERLVSKFPHGYL